MSSSDVVVDVRNLSKRYEIYATPRDRLKQLVLPSLFRTINRAGVALGAMTPHPPPSYFREFWALQGISFQVRRGETVGIIGRNGSGKSTLLQILAGTLTHTVGEATTTGRIAALLELGAGFNPEFTGRDNVLLNGRILGLSEAEIAARYDQIVAFADIGEFIDQPVKTYSSGMFLRLAFAVQAHVAASIVLIDEALAVGDVFFTQKCFTRLRALVESGAAIILVTHDMTTVTQFCSRVLVLDKGREVYQGEPVAAIRRYMSLHRFGSAHPDSLPRPTGGRSISAGRAAPTPEPMEWPPPDAFVDTTAADVVGTGQAQLVGVALCDAAGQPARLFHMGDTVEFFVEYRVLDDIDVPIGGITIVNERGILVHGKNSMQYGIRAPDQCARGTTLRFRQRVVLDIAPGEYTYVLGLATMDSVSYHHSAHMSHHDLAQATHRVLSVGRAGSFTVTLSKDGIALTHHGLANLQGECQLLAVNEEVAMEANT